MIQSNLLIRLIIVVANNYAVVLTRMRHVVERSGGALVVGRSQRLL
jgi:hypothetical protein